MHHIFLFKSEKRNEQQYWHFKTISSQIVTVFIIVFDWVLTTNGSGACDLRPLYNRQFFVISVWLACMIVNEDLDSLI